MKTKFIQISLAILLFTGKLQGNPLVGFEPLSIGSQYPTSFGDKLYFFSDPEHTETISTIKIKIDRFQQQKGNLTTFGYRPGSFWMYFALRNPSANDVVRYLEVDILGATEIDLFDFSTGGVIVKSGILRKHKSRLSRNLVQDVSIPANSTKTYMLRVRSDFSLTTAIHIHDRKSLENRRIEEAWWFGGYFGVILFCCFFNICLFAILNHKPYLHYTFLLFSYHFLFISSNFGHFKYLILPNDTWFNQRSILWAVGLSHIFAVQMLKSMFGGNNLPVSFLWAGRAIKAFCFLLILISSFTMNKFLGGLMVSASLPFIIIYLATLTSLSLKGNVAAGLFAFGWLFLLLANILYILISTNALQMENLEAFRIMTMNTVLIGNIGEVIFLSFSVAYQFNDLKVQNAKEKTLRVQHEERVRDAKTVQETFLKERKPPKGFKLRSFSDFPEKMGGDWFGHFSIKDDSIIVAAIVDVNGHGISSALMTGAIHGSFYSCKSLLHSNLGPLDYVQTISCHLNQTVRDTGEAAGLWATACIAVFHKEAGEVIITNHGHCPPLLWTDNSINFIPLPSLPLGPEEVAIGNTQRLPLTTGMRLILYTDGWVENVPKYGFKQLKRDVNKATVEQVVDSFSQIKERFSEDCEDDYTYIVIEVA